jgi:hypothetical protein
LTIASLFFFYSTKNYFLDGQLSDQKIVKINNMPIFIWQINGYAKIAISKKR